MSMISAQIDKLRLIADKDTVPYEASDAMYQAADTITELRGALLVASVDYRHLQAENAKLREQIHWLKQGDILHVLTDQEYIDQCERERLMQVSIDALDKENAKLRELAHLVAEYTSEDQCEGCVAKRACIEGELDMCWLRKKILEKLRELGIEVV